jgi:hypothetical protein
MASWIAAFFAEMPVMARVDRVQPFVFQGYRLLHSCVSALYSVLKVLKELPDKTA